MKRVIAALLVIILICSFVDMTAAKDITSDPVTITDITPLDNDTNPPENENPPPESDPDPPASEGIRQMDFSVNLSNLYQYSIVALHDATLNGHVRGSIWVGGTLKGGEWKFVDDGSLGGISASTSYVAVNESHIQFRGRTNEQGETSYCGLNDSIISSTRGYWQNLISTLGENDTWIYVEPDENGHVNMQYWDYQCPGSDESQSSFTKVYWTDATSITMGGVAGHIIAPFATVTVVNCNHCGSIVASNIITSGESHINYWTPSNPPDPTPTPSPTPTPTPNTITVTKKLKGEIWSLRCDTMDNTKFKAGGGYWMADINNPGHITSKEGHRSNHCGNRENWVLFVSEEGKAISLYQLKSGSTGGTLPSIVYRAPADLCSIPEHQFIYDPTNPNDVMTNRLINEVFIPQNAMPFNEINLVEGQRLFWISQNGTQVWHHTGVLKKTTPRFAFVINGEPYTLGVGETITLTEVEDGLLEIEEIASSNYKLVEITHDDEGNYVVINEINPPNKPTPTPPPAVQTPTPTPSPTPTPTPTPSQTPTPTPTVTVTVSESPTPTPTPTLTVTTSESPSPTPSPTPTPTVTPTITPTVTPTATPTETPTPTPTVSESPAPTSTETPTITPETSESPSPSPTPTPTPAPTCGFTVKKVVSNYELMEDDAVFFFQIHGVGFEEDEFIEISVDHTTGIGMWEIDGLKPGKYSVEEIDISEEFELVSEQKVTLYVIDTQTFEFTNKFIPKVTPTPTPTPTPASTETPTATPEVTETPTATPKVTETPTPTPTPSVTPRPTLPPEPLPSVIPEPIPIESPNPMIPTGIIGVRKVWNDIDNATGRPDKIDIILYADGEVYKHLVLTDENGWITTIEVPLVTEEGKDIHYSWSENAIIGYVLESEYDQENIHTFTNRVWERPVEYTGQGKQPKTIKKAVKSTEDILDYDTPLGVEIMINHVGDCFD